MTPWVSRPVLFARMAWLKAALWQPVRFQICFALFTLLAAAIFNVVWVAAIQRWRRNAYPEDR